MQKLGIREIQHLQLEALKTVHDFCKSRKINYYIIGGTLLGAIRHRGFIPWDDDIDIAMMRKDYDIFVNEFPISINQNKYFLQNYSTDDEFQPALSRLCIKGTYQDLPFEKHLNKCKNSYIDIFPLDNVPDDNREMLKHMRCLKIIDFIFEWKMGRVYTNGFLYYKFIIKRLIRLILKIIPIRYIKQYRYNQMIKYKTIDTTRVCSTVSKYGYLKQVIDKTVYGEPKLYEFEGDYFCGVSEPDIYLKHIYGVNYMKVPEICNRQQTFDVYLL